MHIPNCRFTNWLKKRRTRKLSEKFSSELLFINIFQGPLKMYINMELKNNQEIWKTLLNSKNVAHSVIE